MGDKIVTNLLSASKEEGSGQQRAAIGAAERVEDPNGKPPGADTEMVGAHLIVPVMAKANKIQEHITGSPVVITPVRRSRRNLCKRSVSPVDLAAANFAFAPNQALDEVESSQPEEVVEEETPDTEARAELLLKESKLAGRGTAGGMFDTGGMLSPLRPGAIAMGGLLSPIHHESMTQVGMTVLSPVNHTAVLGTAAHMEELERVAVEGSEEEAAGGMVQEPGQMCVADDNDFAKYLLGDCEESPSPVPKKRTRRTSKVHVPAEGECKSGPARRKSARIAQSSIGHVLRHMRG
eukprot:TRINITY_DN56339_c0_g1_i1.p1 TRINITY_DN56339_c0_g1~~TRINITY_DN56339_c0_g1_i1.p1  ORF type:complete len:293 (+),score=76.87 TRINITY_DN56339_c0_g1_i1:99-977(+)